MRRTDVLVIGAGPAGITAATAAAEHGRKVIVLDDNPAAGGQIWRGDTVETKDSSKHAEDAPRRKALERLRLSGAEVLPGRSVFSVDASGSLQAIRENTSGSQVEEFLFEKLILATGARERFLPFPGWTLPGVFGAGGLQALVRGGYRIAGKRVVVAGTGPLLLAVAAHLVEDGAYVSAVVEQASLAQLAPFAVSMWSNPGKLLQGAGYRAKLWKSAYRIGCWVVEASASPDGLRSVKLTDGTSTWTEHCDLLACGYHLVPNTEIASLLGCAFRGPFVQVDSDQRTSVPNVFCAGEPTGIAGLEAALVQGEIAGLACAGRDVASLQKRAAAERSFGERLEKAFALREELRAVPREDTLVCRCEDVRLGSLRGHTSWTDAKLQTRCGMGPCQGRICGPAVEHLLGWKPISVRQPLFPVPLQAFGSDAGQTEITESTEITEITERTELQEKR
ncbi:MAG TPA: FAD/NAD(P)-binding oxidoreductase [Acidobacteriaceae bacterium]|jgi:NADPH-dependent 2,4-dienoyl-CoA reductase/sulfur reductase-like enzyme